MRFMNTWEIDEARRDWGEHPLLGPATRTLAELRDAADANSDGWCYWPKPARAANKLMALIEGDDHPEGRRGARFDARREDVTAAKLRAAYAPLKALRTRTGLSFTIHEPSEVLF